MNPGNIYTFGNKLTEKAFFETCFSQAFVKATNKSYFVLLEIWSQKRFLEKHFMQWENQTKKSKYLTLLLSFKEKTSLVKPSWICFLSKQPLDFSQKVQIITSFLN